MNTTTQIIYVFTAMILVTLTMGCLMGLDRYEKKTNALIVMLLAGAAMLLTRAAADSLVQMGLRGLSLFFACVSVTSLYVSVFMYTTYLVRDIEPATYTERRVLMISIVLCTAGTAARCIDRLQQYREGTVGLIRASESIPGRISWGCAIAVMTIDLVLILRYYRKLGIARTAAYATYPLLPAISSLFWEQEHAELIRNLMIAYAMLLMYVVLHVDRNLRFQRQQQHNSELRVALMRNQIRPHFLYNVLNSIYYLIEKDPIQAQKSVEDFSSYLRENLDALEHRAPVAFAKEMDSIRNYLALEKLRFGDELRIEYELRETEFKVPPYLIRPVIENAVKHGLGKKEGGGTLRITSARADDHTFLVTVEDDGVGFDTGKAKKDGHSHLGLPTVQELLAQSGGRMEIESREGSGTRVLIYIPADSGGGGGMLTTADRIRAFTQVNSDWRNRA